MPNPKGNPATLTKYTSKWKNGYTRTIRVPVVLADEILNYAHQLDEGSLTQVNDNGNGKASAITTHQAQEDNLQETLTQVIEALEDVCKTPNTAKFSKTLNGKIQQQIELLKALSQVE